MNTKAKHASLLDVLMDGKAVGRLARDANERGSIWFQYSPEWIKSGYALSPFQPFDLKAGAFKPLSKVFDGLHGVFNDALPDGWGLMLMDRALKKALDWERHDIEPLDRLAYIGSRAMGALEFKPAMDRGQAAPAVSLASLAESALLVEEGSADDVLAALYIHGGSPGGARPKVTVAIERGGDQCMSGFGTISGNFDHWIVKFRARDADPPSMGRIELAYARMAEAAKVDMPATRLISAKVRGKREDFFAVQRFDREGNAKKHVVSLGGMLEASHRMPSMDYGDLLKATLMATKDAREVDKAFRLMVFNVLAHNKDDHVKNFAFVRNKGGWAMTKAFDLTFSAGMGGQHTTSINGEGLPRLEAIAKVARDMQIKDWRDTVAEVFAAVEAWETFATEQKVPKAIWSAYGKAMRAGPCFAELGKSRESRRRS
jgi:serine/threonine-protein kinase HipA